MSPSAAPPGATDWARFGPVAILIAAAGMTAWTWRAWPDALVDIGREFYQAWRLAEGDVLYRDIAHFNGPLAPYVNALWFRLFGPGVIVLAWTNLALAAGMVALLYGMLARLGSRLGATAAGLVFVLVFGFAQYLGVANYNWVCPYSHDLTLGVMVGVAGLACLARHHATGDMRWIIGVGVATGLAVLTKAETLFATALGMGLGLVLTLVAEGATWSRGLRLLFLTLGGAAVPLLVTAALFSLALTPAEVLHGPLGHWMAATHGDLQAMPMYRLLLGTDDIAANLRDGGLAALAWIGALTPALAAAWWLRRATSYRVSVTAVVAVATGVLLYTVVPDATWFEALRPLPLWMLAVIVAATLELRRRRAAGQDARPAALAAALAMFGLGMLGKILFNARASHYGFALAMPATLVAVVAVVDWLPALVDRLGGYGTAVRATALAALVAAMPAHLIATQGFLARKTATLGEGRDRIRADGRGRIIDDAVRALAARAKPDATVAALPAGSLINYLVRRRMPTPYYSFGPLMLALYGEHPMLAALEATPPDYVVLAHANTAGEGATFFGRDYAQRIAAWIDAHYTPIQQFGAPPFRDNHFGVVLLERARTTR